jgi:hypothetical protein
MASQGHAQPGHGLPLSEADIPQLLQLLQAALSADVSTQKQAEAMLASLECRTGFCSCLAVRLEAGVGVGWTARWLCAVRVRVRVCAHGGGSRARARLSGGAASRGRPSAHTPRM